MSEAISSVFTRLILIVTGVGVCFASPENTSPSQRDTQSPAFLQEPPFIHYYVTHNQSANLTWVAMNVCRIQIKCNGKKFQGELITSCRSCRTKTKTKIVTVADFPKAVRNITCKYKVWGKKGVRQSDLILVDRAFLRRDFGTVQVHHVLTPNTTVVLKCRPPYGSPRPNITWYKNSKPSPLLGHDGRRRITSKKDLVIKRVQIGDSGEYQCVARNMAARRVGPVIKLNVRENISTADCQERQWPCTDQCSPDCQSGSIVSSNYGGSNRSSNFSLHPCERSNGECEHFCVYLSLGKRRCLCEQNFQLNENGKTCDKLELRRESRNKSCPNNPTGPSLVVVLLIDILLLVVLGLVISLFKKRCPCQTSQDPPPMTRRSTNPDDTHGDGNKSLELTDQTELECAVPGSNNESSNFIAQESGEPSGSEAAGRDTPVASQIGMVVYVEQHGGVTVVGDDAKVHHHYSPQS